MVNSARCLWSMLRLILQPAGTEKLHTGVSRREMKEWQKAEEEERDQTRGTVDVSLGRKGGNWGETDQEVEVHLRASVGRKNKGVHHGWGRVAGLLLCSKVRGSRKHLFRCVSGESTDHHRIYTVTRRDTEKRYLPKRWSWECWCHIQRKAARPETSVCRQSCRRDRDTWRRPSFHILTHILRKTYQGDAATSHTATQWFSWRRENANMRREHGVKEQAKPWGVNSRQPPGHSEQLIQNLTAHFTEHNPVKYFYFMS